MFINDDSLYKSKNNFDFIRIVAALLVLIGHSTPVLIGESAKWDPFYLTTGLSMHRLGVYIFFIISGFLVTKSWESKKNIFDFFVARFLRIFPALICVVLLSVFILGTILTTVPLSEYFSSELTQKYLQNMSLYRMYYYLPGVFDTNPNGAINSSLWTLPYEFTCYIFLMILGIITFLKSKWNVIRLFIFLTITYLLFREYIDLIVIPIIGIDFYHFYSLLLFFLSGVVFYQFRGDVLFNFKGILICLSIIVCIKFSLLPRLLYIFPISYLIFYLVFSKKVNLNNTGRFGDFSYGIYLYAWPIQQLIVFYLPIEKNVALVIILSVLCVLPFAILSWFYIEKPSIKLRKKFISI